VIVCFNSGTNDYTIPDFFMVQPEIKQILIMTWLMHSRRESKNITVVWKLLLLSLSRFSIAASSGPVGKSALLRAAVGRRPKRNLQLTARERVVAAAVSATPLRVPAFHDHHETTRVLPNEFWVRVGRRRVLRVYILIFVLFQPKSKIPCKRIVLIVIKQIPSTYNSSIFVFVLRYLLLKYTSI